MERLEEKEHAFKTKLAKIEAQTAETLEAKDAEIEELKAKAVLSTEEEDYKAKFEALQSMVGPFKEQLEAYELERQSLMSLNEATQSDLKKLAEQQGQALGHQNHKQKINHLVQLKKERVEMANENAKLTAEVAKLKRQINKMKEAG